MKGSGTKAKDKEREDKYMTQEIDMKDYGIEIKEVGKVYIFGEMAIATTVNGGMIKCLDMV